MIVEVQVECDLTGTLKSMVGTATEQRKERLLFCIVLSVSPCVTLITSSNKHNFNLKIDLMQIV